MIVCLFETVIIEMILSPIFWILYLALLMLQSLVIFFIAFLLSWFIAWVVRRKAISSYQKRNVKPGNGNTRILPIGGGLAIVITFYLCCAVCSVYYDRVMPFQLFSALAMGLFLVICVIVGEAYQLHVVYRLVVHSASIATAMYLLGGVSTLKFDDFEWISPTAYYVLNIVSFLLFVLIVNAFRLYDGANGKEGMLGATVLAIASFAIFLAPQDNVLFFLIPCVAGFLVRNWHPAKHLMGDAGATFLGFVFVVFAVYFQSEYAPMNNGVIPIHIYLLLGLLPLYDFTLTHLMNITKKYGTYNYLYQRLAISGYSPTKINLTQVALTAVMFILASFAYKINTVESVITAWGVALVFLSLYAVWVFRRSPYSN